MFADVCVSRVGGHNLFSAQCVTFQAHFLWEKDPKTIAKQKKVLWRKLFGISSVASVSRLYTQSALICSKLTKA